MSTYGQPYVMTNLSQLVVGMEGHLPGCQPVPIRMQLVETLIEFCRTTGALTARSCRTPIVNGQARYPIEAPFQASLLNVNKVFINDMECHPSSYRVDYTGECGGTISFGVLPYGADHTWHVEASWVPLAGVEELPRHFMEQWGHAIMYGALAHLMANQNARWSNQTMAMVNDRKYELAKQDAVYRRLASNTHDGRLTFQNTDHFVGGF